MDELKKIHVTKEPEVRRSKLKEKLNKLPEKKPHLDLIAAILSIPVLLTVLLLNLLTLQSKTVKATPTLVPSQGQTQTTSNQTGSITPIVVTTKPQPTADTTQCTPGIAPLSIDSPTDGQVVSDNPVCINIHYNQENYCSSVWAYKINNSTLSDYSNNSVCLYNLPAGQNTFQLFVKSLNSSATTTLIRNFTVKSTIAPSTPNPTTATSSAQ